MYVITWTTMNRESSVAAMLHNAVLAALRAAAAGTADAKRLVGHCSAPANDRSQTTQLFPVRKNLIIFYGATAGWCSWTKAMGNCWDQHTHGTSKTARCRMASTPVRLATQCATNGSNISSNFATDFKRLSSVQQRKRSALHLEEILARTERPRRYLHMTSMCNTSVMAFIRRSAERQQVGAAAAAMLLVLAEWPAGSGCSCWC